MVCHPRSLESSTAVEPQYFCAARFGWHLTVIPGMTKLLNELKTKAIAVASCWRGKACGSAAQRLRNAGRQSKVCAHSGVPLNEGPT
jgi:hypothetical protein